MLGVLVFLILVARPLPLSWFVSFLFLHLPLLLPSSDVCFAASTCLSQSADSVSLHLRECCISQHSHTPFSLLFRAYFYTSPHSLVEWHFELIRLISLFFEVQTNCTCMKRKRKYTDSRIFWEEHFRIFFDHNS